MNFTLEKKYSVVDTESLEVLVRFLIENIEQMPSDFPMYFLNDIHESLKLKSYQYFNQQELLRRLKRNETAKKKSTNSRKRTKRTSRARLRKKVQPLAQRKTKSGQSKIEDGSEDGSAKIISNKFF